MKDSQLLPANVPPLGYRIFSVNVRLLCSLQHFHSSWLCCGNFAHGAITALVLWVMKLLVGSLVTLIAAVPPGMWWGVDIWGCWEGWKVHMLRHSPTPTLIHMTPCWARHRLNLPLIQTVEQGQPWFAFGRTHTWPPVHTVKKKRKKCTANTDTHNYRNVNTHTHTDGELIRTNWSSWPCIFLHIRQWSHHSKLLITF